MGTEIDGKELFPLSVQINAEYKPEEYDEKKNLLKGEILLQGSKHIGTCGRCRQRCDGIDADRDEEDKRRPEDVRPVFSVGDDILKRG